MTLSEVTGIIGSAGDFTVTVKEAPRYVDMEKCIACGACTEKCPKKVDSEYNAGIGKRKAIYVKYAQAVPLKYQIDPVNLHSSAETGRLRILREGLRRRRDQFRR